MEKLKVLLSEPGKELKVIEVNNDIEAQKALVDGDLYDMKLAYGIAVVFNKNMSITRNMPFNFWIDNKESFIIGIKGLAFYTGMKNGEYISIIDKQIEIVKNAIIPSRSGAAYYTIDVQKMYECITNEEKNNFINEWNNASIHKRFTFCKAAGFNSYDAYTIAQKGYEDIKYRVREKLISARYIYDISFDNQIKFERTQEKHKMER